jgi:hypothetical protein
MQAHAYRAPRAAAARPPLVSAPRPVFCPRAAPRRVALRVSALAAGQSDHTVRVRGSPQQVSFFVSDAAAWPAWSPITKKGVKLGVATDLIRKGSKFELQQNLWGVLSYTML